MTTFIIVAVCAAVLLGAIIFFIAKLESKTNITLEKVKEEALKNTLNLSKNEDQVEEKPQPSPKKKPSTVKKKTVKKD